MELSVTAVGQAHDAEAAWRPRRNDADGAQPSFAFVIRETQRTSGGAGLTSGAGVPKDGGRASAASTGVTGLSSGDRASNAPAWLPRSQVARSLAQGLRRPSPEPLTAHVSLVAPHDVTRPHAPPGVSGAVGEIRRGGVVATSAPEPSQSAATSLQVLLGNAPVGGVAVSSLPDGALTLRIGVTPSRTGNLSRELGDLRRRLEARGLRVDEIVVSDIADERELMRG